jgi:hypothetical protein
MPSSRTYQSFITASESAVSGLHTLAASMQPSRRTYTGARTARQACRASLLLLIIAAAPLHAQGRNPADRRLLAEATGALLKADGPLAQPALEAMLRTATDSTVVRIAACMRDRLLSSRAELVPVSETSPLASRVITRYRRYWSDATARPAQRDSLLNALWDDLRRMLAVRSTASAARVEHRLGDTLATLGLQSLRGRTGVLRELMIWTKPRDTTYTIALPERQQQVRVVFLDGFVSLGWSNFMTCDHAGTSGWTKPDGLFVVAPNYQSTTNEEFRVNFLAHEGQHFADAAQFPALRPWEKEYRAKLVELAYADSTLKSTLDAFEHSQGTDHDDPHAYANNAVLADMRRNIGEPQVATLTMVPRSTIALAALALLREDTRTRRAKQRPRSP